jgi:hypothetical protein
MQDNVAALDVEVENGYLSGCEIEVEVSRLKLEEIEIDDIGVLDFDGNVMTCAVYFEGRIAMDAYITRHATWRGADDYDLGSRHTQAITVTVPLSASVDAERAPDGSVELTEAVLEHRRITVPWYEVERDLD